MRIGSQLALVCLTSLGLASTTLAAKPGHGSVMSPAGAPLRVEIPLYELTASDADALKVTVGRCRADCSCTSVDLVSECRAGFQSGVTAISSALVTTSECADCGCLA